MRLALYTTSLISAIIAQINLGQFSLLPTPGNGWNLGMSQGANIFGFGGHRALGISGNNGGIGMSGTDNVIIGNERVGLDSGLGIGQGQGLNLGSMLQFGNSPNPMHPSGHMGNFLDNIKNFFASLIPQPAPPPPPPMPLPRRRHRPRPTQQPPEELWESTSEEPDAWAPERMTSRSPLEVVLPSRPHRISTEGGVGPDGFLPRPWENQGNVAPVDGDSSLLRHTFTEDPFPTLIPTTPEPWRNIETADGQDHFNSRKERPRQLPGLVEMSHQP